MDIVLCTRLLADVEARYPMRLVSLIIEEAMRRVIERSPRFLARFGRLQGGWVISREGNAVRLTKVVYGPLADVQLTDIDRTVISTFATSAEVWLMGVELACSGGTVSSSVQIKRLGAPRNVLPCSFESEEARIASLIDAWFADCRRMRVGRINLLAHTRRWNLRDVRDLLALRCFINTCRSPVADVDGFSIDGESGRLGLFEIKRKGPAGGMYEMPIEKPRAFFEALSTDVLLAIKGRDSPDRSQMDRAIQLLGYPRVNSPCFGLDVLHAETATWCADMGVDYTYVVMIDPSNPPRDVEGQKKFLKSMVRRGELAHHYRWWVWNYSGAFNGFSFTLGGDSGSYSRRIRWQAMVDFEKGRVGKTAAAKAIEGRCPGAN